MFQKKFCETMISMIHAPEYAAVFECFRTAYEYRRNFRWLAESRDTPDVINQDGLAYALRAALTSYIVLEPTELENEVTPAMPKDMNRGEDKHIEGEWANRLVATVSATIREGFSLERFENHLCNAQVDVAISPPDVLSKHVAAALISYYKRRKIGISPDPF